MDIGSSFLKTKLARRFTVFFLLCAFLPTLILVGISYERVERQLQENILSHFKALSFYTWDHEIRSLKGNLPLDIITTVKEKVAESKKTTIITLDSETSHPAVFMAINYSRATPQEGLVVAEIDPQILWGEAALAMLPSMTEVAVYDDQGKIMSTSISPGEKLSSQLQTARDIDTRHFQYFHKKVNCLVTKWPLFLTSQFNGNTWTIVLSQARAEALHGMLEFKRMFPLTILLMLWIILFLVFFYIRKTLEPLHALNQGTLRIASGDLQTQVQITSKDEFEDLGKAYNQMTSGLNKQFKALAVIDKIDRAIFSSLDLHVIVSRALQMMLDYFDCTFIMFARLSVSRANHIELFSYTGGGQKGPNLKYVELSNNEISLLFGKDNFTLLEQSAPLPTFVRTFLPQGTYLLSLPLHNEEKTFGSILMEFPISSRPMVSTEIAQARQIGDQLTIALSNSDLVYNLERLSIGTVEALARTVDAKSKWTAGHSERVAELAMILAKAMEYPAKDIELIYRAGLLHDIGKIGIPLAILDKPGKLTDEEFLTIKSHPSLGGQILEPIEAYEEIIPIITQHHEQYNGKGYPDALSGEDIDPRARVLTLADVYDALISSRPYRDGLAREKVMAFVKDNSRQIFDPDVVEAFLSLPHE